jgi:hypothetical protein
MMPTIGLVQLGDLTAYDAAKQQVRASQGRHSTPSFRQKVAAMTARLVCESLRGGSH